MKRKNIFRISVAFWAMTAFTSCSDQFMQDKQNFDSTTADAYNYWSGALGRVADVYRVCLPDPKATPSSMYNSTGLADDQSKSTEEYSGFSAFVDPLKPLTYQTGNNPVPDYFEGTKGDPITSAYGRIRNINDVIAGIEGSTLSQEEKNELLGQVYFFRAWCYYNLVNGMVVCPSLRKYRNLLKVLLFPVLPQRIVSNLFVTIWRELKHC